jgi:hypothetical protein
MKRILILFGFLLFSATGFAGSHDKLFPAGSPDDNEYNTRNGWFIKTGYIKQAKSGWAEFSVARWRQAQYIGEEANFSAAAVGISLGSEFGFGDTTFVYAPKVGVEMHLLFIGFRSSFARYMKADKGTNCFSIEGGLCVLSVLYVYAGYNWMLGDVKDIVEPSGPKFAIGLNIPFGMRDAGIYGVGKNHQRNNSAVHAFH